MTETDNYVAGERSSAQRLAALRAGGDGWAPPPDGATQPETTAPIPIVARRSRWSAWMLARRARSRWRKVRLDPGRRGALVLASIAGVAAVISAIGVLRDQPVAQEPPPLAAFTEARGTAESTPGVPGDPVRSVSSTPSTEPVVVSVVGKVRHPGLVSLPAGSRVADAIGKAGGALRGADLTTVNLASRVSDGEQIAVGVPAVALSPSTPSTPSTGSSGAPGADAPAHEAVSAGRQLDLNQATVAQLDTLPGIGPVTAQRIVDWRTQHGQFRSVGQLREVSGIGDRRLGQLKTLVMVVGGPAR
jgi:competence protein ComEA